MKERIAAWMERLEAKGVRVVVEGDRVVVTVAERTTLNKWESAWLGERLIEAAGEAEQTAKPLVCEVLPPLSPLLYRKATKARGNDGTAKPSV